MYCSTRLPSSSISPPAIVSAVSAAAPALVPQTTPPRAEERLHRGAGLRATQLRHELHLIAAAEEDGARVVDARRDLAVELRVVALHERELRCSCTPATRKSPSQSRALPQRVRRRVGDADDRAAHLRARGRRTSRAPRRAACTRRRSGRAFRARPGRHAAGVGAAMRGGVPVRRRVMRPPRPASSRARARPPPASVAGSVGSSGPASSSSPHPSMTIRRRARAPPRARAALSREVTSSSVANTAIRQPGVARVVLDLPRLRRTDDHAVAHAPRRTSTLTSCDRPLLLPIARRHVGQRRVEDDRHARARVRQSRLQQVGRRDVDHECVRDPRVARAAAAAPRRVPPRR